MRAARRLIRSHLCGNNGRGGHRALGEIFGVLKLVFAMRVPKHLFGKIYAVILKRIENWNEPEECVTGYAEVFYSDNSKTEQSSGAGIYLTNKQRSFRLKCMIS